MGISELIGAVGGGFELKGIVGKGFMLVFPMYCLRVKLYCLMMLLISYLESTVTLYDSLLFSSANTITTYSSSRVILNLTTVFLN